MKNKKKIGEIANKLSYCVVACLISIQDSRKRAEQVDANEAIFSFDGDCLPSEGGGHVFEIVFFFFF